eukprot:TRINITY_DN46994_c0_g1_i1.p1 TRINITY_DN46994_c0_g1~~TRINITY_DN46994_c0_g1_i1.p1  ORF type:complete len:209 (+),score=32.15 TRINITY_DN46994_c0_g1_i1:128-754(+)
MQRGLVGSEMCIRDRWYQRRVHGSPIDEEREIAYQKPSNHFPYRNKFREFHSIKRSQRNNVPDPKLLEACNEASRIEPSPIDKLSNDNRRHLQGIIKNALNLAQGIAFNSHANRFEPKTLHERTPGPGQYEFSSSSRKIPVPHISPEKQRRGAAGVNAEVGPGEYDIESSLLKRSYNITLPNNIITTRKERLIQDRVKEILQIFLLVF